MTRRNPAEAGPREIGRAGDRSEQDTPTGYDPRGWSPDPGHLPGRPPAPPYGSDSLFGDERPPMASPRRRMVARHTDPPTSRRAGQEHGSRLVGQLHRDLQAAGSRGLTDDELAAMHPDHPAGSISKRRHDLLVAGEVRDSGRTRRTRWGREAIVWELVP